MLTTPANILTLIRILIIPVLIALFYIPGPYGVISAGVLFTIAGLTDYFDGALARQHQHESNIGRFLDPLADKLLITAAIIMLVGFDHISGLTIIPAIIIICREILVSGLREYLGSMNVTLPVTYLAKWKTGFQMTGIGCLIINDTITVIPFTFVGFVTFWVAGILTLITGYDYLKQSLKYLK